MSRSICKNISKQDFQWTYFNSLSKYTANSGFTSQNAKDKHINKEKPNPEHRRESTTGNETLRRKYICGGSMLFRDKELLPLNDGIIWIHKRWLTPQGTMGCPEKSCRLARQECPDPGLLDPGLPQPRVAILGAGLAGLTAAGRLAQAGFNNIQIFEATDRLGGRIHSCLVGESVVAELGASWITKATQANPLYSLAAQEDLLKQPLAWRRKPKPAQTVFLTSDGRAVDTRIAEPAYRMYERVRDQASALFTFEHHKDTSLENFMKRRLEEEAKAIPEHWRPDAFRVFWGLANDLKSRWGVGPEKLSSSGFGSEVDLPGGSLRLPLGILGILGPLLNKFSQKCIQTCTSVEEICWAGETGNSRARLRLSGGREPIGVDYVLITLPLGVLKAKHETLFRPELPPDRTEAIRKLGWATLDRFLLKYERPFWLEGEGFWRFVWSQEEQANKQSWIKGLSVLEEVPGAHGLLAFALGGEEAEMTENCSDEAIIEAVTGAIRKSSGDTSLPYPKALIRSRWGSDQHFLGSTSYLCPGGGPSYLCSLGKPVPTPERPVLLFAGEATAPGHHGSLLGAHLSGLREAERILQLTRKFSGPPPPIC